MDEIVVAFKVKSGREFLPVIEGPGYESRSVQWFLDNRSADILQHVTEVKTAGGKVYDLLDGEWK